MVESYFEGLSEVKNHLDTVIVLSEVLFGEWRPTYKKNTHIWVGQ
jgi:hypothetical protein